MDSITVFRTYNLDYLGKYNFYEEDELITLRDDGQYIVDNLKNSNRFDYDGASYTYTKYGNISEGRTEKNVQITIEENDINVKINSQVVHLDLIYKMDIKELEDHVRITTRISEKIRSVSCLMYIGYKENKDFIEALNKVKELQKSLAEPKDEATTHKE